MSIFFYFPGPFTELCGQSFHLPVNSLTDKFISISYKLHALVSERQGLNRSVNFPDT